MLSGWDYEKRIDYTEAGGGNITNFTYNHHLYYNCSPIVENGIFEWFVSGAFRYSGAHDRTYLAYYSTNSTVNIKYWDEDDQVLSSAVQLWSSWGSGNDHSCPSTIVLQHQGDGNDGKILVAVAEHNARLQTRRSTYAEFDDSGTPDTSFDAAVAVEATKASYGMLRETDDGTVWLFYRVAGPAPAPYTPADIYFRTSADGGASWSDRVQLFDRGANGYTYIMIDNTDDDSEIHCMFNYADYGDAIAGRYKDIYYAKMAGVKTTSTATSTSANKLVDSSADFVTLGVAAGWRVYNTTDGTHTYVTAVDDLNTLSLNDDIMANTEGYKLFYFAIADGSVKYLSLDDSDADHTLDSVYTTDADDWTYLWDIKLDSSDNPYLIFLNDEDRGGGVGGTCDVHRAYYDAGWNTADTGIDSGRFGTYQYAAGAVMDDSDPANIIYSCVPDGSGNEQLQDYELVGGTWFIADVNNGNTAICDDGKITQGSPGDNFRPMTVINGAGSFTLFWCYTEKYTDFYLGNWESMIFGYPGLFALTVSGRYIGLFKNSRTDFGDVRWTQSDGATLQPAATDGKPGIEYKHDGWMASIWIQVGEIPAAGGTLTTYVHYGNASATNDEEDPSILDSNCIQAENFEWGSDGDDITDSGGEITWTERGGNAEIDEGQYKGGSRCMLITTDPSYINFPQAAGTTYAVSFWFRKLDAADFYFSHGNGTERIYWKLDSSENIQTYNGGWNNTGYDGQAAKWQHAIVSDINHSTPKYDLWYGLKDTGDILTKVANDADMWANGTNQDVIEFALFTSANGVWIDNVIVYKYSSTLPTVTLYDEESVQQTRGWTWSK